MTNSINDLITSRGSNPQQFGNLLVFLKKVLILSYLLRVDESVLAE